MLYVETGARLREFIKKEYKTSQLTSDIMHAGGLLPEFIPIWIWTQYLIENFTGEEHLILDGLSRRVAEAPVLDSALRFYGFSGKEKKIVISINASKEGCVKRLLGRGRPDDTREDIEERLSWYDTNVSPVLDYFKKNSEYIFLEINGDQPIPKVHSEIVQKVFSSKVTS